MLLLEPREAPLCSTRRPYGIELYPSHDSKGQRPSAPCAKVEIDHCTVHDFQKNGITADEKGTLAIIHRNVVTGLGPTTGAAQNGVQIGFGVAGSIVNNTVTNNVWAPTSQLAPLSRPTFSSRSPTALTSP